MPEMTRLERAFCTSPPWRLFAKRLALPWALQGVELRGDVLEIGAGSGAMAEQILEAHPDVRMTVTDVDPAMVERAAGRLERFGERARVVEADVTALDFDDRSFDLVLSFIMVHHVVEWERAVAEVSRVLRPGGRFVGYDIAGTAPARWLHQVQREYHRFARTGEFRRALEELPFGEVLVRRAFAGAVMRFRATRGSTESAS